MQSIKATLTGRLFNLNYLIRKDDYMQEEVRAARTHRLVKFGVLANRVINYKFGVPKSVVRELVDFRLSLDAMLEDEELGEVANNSLKVLDSLIEYCRALNNGDMTLAAELKEQSAKLWDTGDKIINKILKE